MPKCTYCSTSVMQGRGKILMALNGKQIFLCSGKCEKNYNLGREAKKLGWIRKKKKKGKIN